MSGNYGIKVSKEGVDAISAAPIDTVMNTRYPFAKIDPTQTETFRTTTVTFLNDTTDNVKTLIASFAHGYTYKPQMWGLWNITWGASIIGTPGLVQNGYGTVTNSSGAPSSSISYEIDATTVYLYVTKGAIPPIFPSDITGTSATLTTYIFVDDYTEASYI